jgi:hypothetical protein
VLSEVADGVWVRQSEWVWTNSIVVRGGEGLVVIDPGIHGAELEELADEVEGLGGEVVAGFSTHPHFDHLLWHSRLGEVPRYATAACAEVATAARERARAMAAESAEGVPLELVARVHVLVPGHGAVAAGPEIARRLAADRAYIAALREGEEPDDARLRQDWLAGPHRSNVERARGS